MDVTTKYYYKHTPEYLVEHRKPWYDALVQTLEVNKPCRRELSLLDIGCGDGTTIQYLKEHIGIDHCTGLDISPKYVSLARSHGHRVLLGSILDLPPAQLIGRYDYVLLITVLHHLIGATMRASRGLAFRSLCNAAMFLRPGAVLVVVDISFPKWVNMSAFWVKRILSRFRDDRIQCGSSWLNVGLPVVSLYQHHEVQQLLHNVPNLTSVQTSVVCHEKFGPLTRQTYLCTAHRRKPQ